MIGGITSSSLSEPHLLRFSFFLTGQTIIAGDAKRRLAAISTVENQRDLGTKRLNFLEGLSK